MESYINSLLGTGSDEAARAEGDDLDLANLHVDPDTLLEPDEQLGGGVEEAGSRPLLPFPFAKRCGAYVMEDLQAEGQQVVMYHREQIDIGAIAEIQRFLGRSFACQTVDDSRFDAMLARAYESRNTEAMQMVEDLGDEMDLASLADSVPESEDLLEQEDDAPIIRLINALLTEAVKENASDIHIET